MIDKNRFDDLEVRVKKKDEKKKSMWDKMFKRKNLDKPNYVGVIYLTESGSVETFEREVKKGFINVDGQQYHERKDCTWRYGRDGTPVAVIRQGEFAPIGTPEYYARRKDESDINLMKRKFAECQDHLLRGIRNAEFVKLGGEDNKKLNTKSLIIWLIVGIVAFALLKGGGLA